MNRLDKFRDKAVEAHLAFEKALISLEDPRELVRLYSEAQVRTENYATEAATAVSSRADEEEFVANFYREYGRVFAELYATNAIPSHG